MSALSLADSKGKREKKKKEKRTRRDRLRLPRSIHCLNGKEGEKKNLKSFFTYCIHMCAYCSVSGKGGEKGGGERERKFVSKVLRRLYSAVQHAKGREI